MKHKFGTGNKQMKLLFLITFFVGISLISFSQNQQATYKPPMFTDANRMKKIEAAYPLIDSVYRQWAEKNHYPGFAYGLVVDGKLVHAGAFGFTDVEKKIPATSTSLFRIASMTKSFTAMAIVKLRDEGKLSLDDPAEKYIPDMKNLHYLTADAPVITIRHLLTHSAGFPEDNPWGDRQLDGTDAELIEMIKKGIFFSNDAGIGYEYSNLAFALLGHIINVVSGQSYEDYITQNILQPLGMNHTVWEYEKAPANELAHGYRWLNNSWVEQPLLHDGSFGAMGGLITSVEDFARYMAFHQSATPPGNAKETGPVKRSSVREMEQPWTMNALMPHFLFPDGRECGAVTAYCYGLRWMKDCDNRVYVSHTGGLPGFGSEWKILPDYGIGVVSFANLTYAGVSIVNLGVLDTLIQVAQLQPRQLPPSRILQQRRNDLMKMLPDWNQAENAHLFADNFFLDYSVDSLKKETAEAFADAGKILSVGDVVPENQLRGTFTIEGEKKNLFVNFTLTPENPPLIQHFTIKEESKK